MEPLDLDLDESEIELTAEPMLINVGPSHPAMHGTVRCVMELSGENIMIERTSSAGWPNRSTRPSRC